jgi:hypothetical protein
MRKLEDLSREEIRDLLGKGWLTHDGMWFYNASQELGIDQANALNKAAIKSQASIEVRRAMKILGMGEELRTFGELQEFMVETLRLTLPASVFEKFHLAFPAKNSLHWEWEKQECFAYKGMKQMGTIDEYRCGVMYRIECWLETLGIDYRIHPKLDRCIMHTEGACSGMLEFFFAE